MFMKEKAVYEAKAAKRKADYEKQLNLYNKKQVNQLPYPIFISSSALLDLVLDFFYCHNLQESVANGEVNDEEDEASGEVI